MWRRLAPQPGPLGATTCNAPVRRSLLITDCRKSSSFIIYIRHIMSDATIMFLCSSCNAMATPGLLTTPVLHALCIQENKCLFFALRAQPVVFDFLLKGVRASHEMAEMDADRMEKYRSKINTVGKSCGIDPALIAAIISRESRAGNALINGWGDGGKAFGLMQVVTNTTVLSASCQKNVTFQ